MTEIFGLTLPELTNAVEAIGLKKFRARQIFKWIYQKSVFDFAAMTDLGKSDIAKLAENFTILPANLKVLRSLKSRDGLTEKILLELPDGNSVETVLMRHDYGYSVCVSSQVGCDMHCAFCASGLKGAVRNLLLGEILAQVYLFSARLNEENAVCAKRVSRVVVMGSGEPMLNFDNVFGALKFLHDENAVHMSYRNMTVSTCGIIPGICRMTELGAPINLAVSLHCVRNELRSELMPVNRAYPFTDVIAAAERYAQSSGRNVTYEYILLAGRNDSDMDAELLADFLRFKRCSVNLIPANPVPEQGFARPGKKRIEKFHAILTRRHVAATVRKEMGEDINAACGMLRAGFAAEA